LKLEPDLDPESEKFSEHGAWFFAILRPNLNFLTYNEHSLTLIPPINEEHFMNSQTMNSLHVAI